MSLKSPGGDFDLSTWYNDQCPDDDLATEFLVRQHHERLKAFPFLSYSAKNCFRHCKDEFVQEAVMDTLLKAFTTERSGRFINMTYTCVYNSNESCMSSYTRVFRYSLISVTTRYGLTGIVQVLLDRGVDADYLPLRPSWIEAWPEGQTALHRAADFGFEKTCRILIDAGANVHGTSLRDCPLAAAGRSGKPAVVRLLIDSGVDVRRDPYQITETMSVAWQRYAEGFEEWKAILDILREAGVRWTVVGLLAAFAGSVVPYTRRLAEWLNQKSAKEATPREPSIIIQSNVDRVDTKTLTALQWLVQDPHGHAGVKASISRMFQKIYEYQPHLFTPNTTGPTSKYTLDEVFAENMINRYFKCISPVDRGLASPETPSIHHFDLHVDWLASGCDLLPEPLDFEVVVCGPILQTFLPNRWHPAFAHLFD